MDDLDRIDRALIGLRHLWTRPARQVADPVFGDVEMSTVWIVDALARAERPGMTIGDLAAIVGVTSSTASRLVERAQSSGAVDRHPGLTDARTVSVTLTETGRSLAAAAHRARTDFLAQTTTGWTADERASFADLLERFADAVAATAPHQPGPH